MGIPRRPTLVVDFGTWATSAAVVMGDGIGLLAEPTTGALRWPAATGPVPEGQLLGNHLAAVQAEAARLHGTRLDRLVLTTPPGSGSRRELLLDVAAAAGYPDVELVNAQAAAAIAGPGHRQHSLVLVCDLGASWTVALVTLGGGHGVLVEYETSGAGLQTRVDLEHFAEPALRWLVASCRAVLARAGHALGDLDGCVLVGGGSRLVQARAVLEHGLGIPVHQPADPELAVIRGAARWAGEVGAHRVIASQPSWRAEPLGWDLPDSPGRLLRWLVDEGQPYLAGAPLIQVRTGDDRVYDLVAAHEGILLECRIQPGALLESGAVAGMTRTRSIFARDRPTSRHRLRVVGEWLLTPDRDQLVECPDSGEYARIRSLDHGTVSTEVRPARHGVAPQRGRVFMHPTNGPHLIAWDATGHFYVWELSSNKLMASFTDAGAPQAVLVDEARWRLISDCGRKVHVGRYRRDVATVWDLATGARLDEVSGQDLQRQASEYAERSTAGGFAAEALSPDGRLRATTHQQTVSVHTVGANPEHEVFRTDAVPAVKMRVAFDADGHHLVAAWTSDGTAWLEVWQL